MTKPNVTIINFPVSQLCFNCDFGEPITSDKYSSCEFLCTKACTENIGIECPNRQVKGVSKPVYDATEDEDTN